MMEKTGSRISCWTVPLNDVRELCTFHRISQGTQWQERIKNYFMLNHIMSNKNNVLKV